MSVAIGLPDIVAALMLMALIAYVLTGGADFGGGVWDLFASGPRKQEQRDHIATSLAPIWEANHVWLIVVVVMLFTAFPAAFSALSTVLHIPLTMMLVGIVLRGSAFVFRSYGAHTDAQRRRWGTAFAVASIVTPVFLGVIVGALSTGAVGAAAARAGAPTQFGEVFVAPWVGLFPFAIGLFALALFAFLAAVYLAHNAPSDDLREDFRNRALIASGAVFAIALLALLAAMRAGHAHILRGALSLPVQLLTAVAAVTAIGALWRRAPRIARIAAAAQTIGILLGWALAIYPFIVPGLFTIPQAAAPRPTLVLLLEALAIGGLILIPALRYLYRLFLRPEPI